MATLRLLSLGLGQLSLAAWTRKGNPQLVSPPLKLNVSWDNFLGGEGHKAWGTITSGHETNLGLGWINIMVLLMKPPVMMVEIQRQHWSWKYRDEVHLSCMQPDVEYNHAYSTPRLHLSRTASGTQSMLPSLHVTIQWRPSHRVTSSIQSWPTLLINCITNHYNSTLDLLWRIPYKVIRFSQARVNSCGSQPLPAHTPPGSSPSRRQPRNTLRALHHSFLHNTGHPIACLWGSDSLVSSLITIHLCHSWVVYYVRDTISYQSLL